MLEKLAHTFLIPPGEHLRNWMDDERIGVAEFARRIGVSTQTVQNILAGNQAITPEMAYHLRLATGVSASFWTNLEANYQIEKLRCVKAEEEARIKDWLQSFPLIDLRNRGILPTDFKSLGTSRQLEVVLSFFGVASISAYEKSFNTSLFAARTVKGLESDEPALMAWVRLGQREAEQMELPAFDVTGFRQLLKDLPKDTLGVQPDNDGIRKWLVALREHCRNVGVALVFVRQMKGVRHVNGAAHWLKDNPTIQLSLYGKTFDRLLFSFCHEAAHILKQNKSLFYVNCGKQDKAELEADGMASAILLPRVSEDELRRTRGSKEELESIAERHGVYKGIVFGRYCKLSDYRQSLHLLREIAKFEWRDNREWKVS